MKSRFLILTPMCALGLAAATQGSTASSTGLAIVTTTPAPSVDAALPALTDRLTDPLADAFGRESAIHVQRGARDLAHHTLDRARAWLDSFAAQSGLHVPDVSVLAVDPIGTDTSSGFGWREDPINSRRKFHNGADFRGKHGAPVVAAGDGVVSFCGSQNGYGNVVYVDHGGGVVTRYAHLKKIETKRDAPIKAGQRIGQVGSTGRTTGPHLHFEVRLDGRAVDPVTALTVAAMTRESPPAGRLAAYLLSPEVQAVHKSTSQPQKSGKKKARPERSGRTKRERPLS